MQYHLKIDIITASLCSVFISDFSAAKNAELRLITPKIIGGEQATETAWPWMSALVYTYNEVSTTLTVDNSNNESINYESQAFSGGISGSATGDTIGCGMGDDTSCSGATNKICLLERGDIDFSVKVENCQAGGGVGAIIYNNIEECSKEP